MTDTARRAWIAAALVALVAASYQGVRRSGFLRYDDNLYVSGNPHVQRGLSPESVRWAFEADLLYDSPFADYWAPLTVISRLVDAELFGMDPAGHHLTNVALHALNAVLLLTVLHAMTGALWRSAFVAAVLAVHPLNVEAVAWVTARKDVLSGAFWMLSLLAYLAWVRAPGPGRRAALLAAFACGLMAKPMLATLPFVLLLLDHWPLGRAGRGLPALAAEKWPLFLLSAAAVAIAFSGGGHWSTPLEELSPGARAGTAAAGYAGYLRQAFWPGGLAVGYPHPGRAPEPMVLAASLAVLALVSLAAAAWRARHPYLAVGWCWYLGTLVPVIGLVQVGVQARADRFVYLPLIGVSIAVCWLAGSWAGRSATRRRAAAAAGLAALAALAILTHRQVGYWKDDASLFGRAASVLPDSAIAHSGMAGVHAQRGDLEQAEASLRRALEIRPDLVLAARQLAMLLLQTGRAEEAARVAREGLDASVPRGALSRSELHLTLGLIRARQGRPEEAEAEYARAVQAYPGQWAALYNWGNLLAAQGRLAEAEARYREAARHHPDEPDLLNNLGLSVLLQGRAEEAAALLRRGVERFPRHARLRTSLGRALAAAGRAGEALGHLREAVRLDPHSPEARRSLAEAEAAAGRAAP